MSQGAAGADETEKDLGPELARTSEMRSPPSGHSHGCAQGLCERPNQHPFLSPVPCSGDLPSSRPLGPGGTELAGCRAASVAGDSTQLWQWARTAELGLGRRQLCASPHFDFTLLLLSYGFGLHTHDKSDALGQTAVPFRGLLARPRLTRLRWPGGWPGM